MSLMYYPAIARMTKNVVCAVLSYGIALIKDPYAERIAYVVAAVFLSF